MDYLTEIIEEIQETRDVFGWYEYLRLIYVFGGISNGSAKTGISPEESMFSFHQFHNFAAKKYDYFEATAEWYNIILKENGNDEEKNLMMFFELFDKFLSEREMY